MNLDLTYILKTMDFCGTVRPIIAQPFVVLSTQAAQDSVGYWDPYVCQLTPGDLPKSKQFLKRIQT